ncbi:MAG: class I SAM-dependent methyltransferase [Bacteroidota bacterium]
MGDLSKLPYVDKEDPWSSHAVIARWLRKLPENSVILDIGTASGTIGRLCNGLGLVRKGVEPNSAWAELARPYYEDLSVTSIEAAENEFIQGADAVILADVLEHLPDPETTLKRVVSLQQPECLIIISVPNVANIWVRLNLLFGRFEYSERGILDQTHLRFFTRSSLVGLLDRCNLDCRQFQPTPIPLNVVHPFFRVSAAGRRLHQALAAVTRFLPSLLGYQFVVLAVKRTIGRA